MYNVDAMGVMIGNQRKKLGMTQKELAEKLGVSVQAVSKWETGIGFPDITIIPTIAVTLNLSLNELFGALPVEKTDTADTPDAGEPFSLPAEGETLTGTGGMWTENEEIQTESREELPFSEAPRAPETDDPFGNDGDDSPELRAHLDDLLDDAEQAVKETRQRIVIRPQDADGQGENAQSEKQEFTGNPSGEWYSEGNTTGEWHDTDRRWKENSDPFGQFGKVAEDFGEKAGKWGEKFGEQIGDTLDRLGNTIESNINAKVSAAFQNGRYEAGIPREWSFASLPGLSLHISGKVNAFVHPSDDGQTHIFAQGTKGFLDTLNINKSGDILRIVAHPIGKSAFSPVECTLDIQTGYEAGSSAEIVCTGSGKVVCTPFYDRAMLSVVGSAGLQFGNSRTCQASVSGAGHISVGRSQQLQISIIGAGNASFEYAEDAKLNCSGTGNIRGEHMMGKALVYLTGSGNVDIAESLLTEVSAVLSGSGSLSLGTLQADKTKFSLAGYGRIRVFGGETAYLQVIASGCGRIDAENLSAKDAEIRLSGGAALTLHAVRGKLKHSVGHGSRLNIQESPV